MLYLMLTAHLALITAICLAVAELATKLVATDSKCARLAVLVSLFMGTVWFRHAATIAGGNDDPFDAKKLWVYYAQKLWFMKEDIEPNFPAMFFFVFGVVFTVVHWLVLRIVLWMWYKIAVPAFTATNKLRDALLELFPSKARSLLDARLYYGMSSIPNIAGPLYTKLARKVFFHVPLQVLKYYNYNILNFCDSNITVQLLTLASGTTFAILIGGLYACIFVEIMQAYILLVQEVIDLFEYTVVCAIAGLYSRLKSSWENTNPSKSKTVAEVVKGETMHVCMIPPAA
tara:strand:- start:386 stop:1246 length:861 start_codon:yes stop_codon:yes gene_type:complete